MGLGLRHTTVRKKPEKSDDNDTSAGREYGGRALARDMLQRDRVLQGARRPQGRSYILRSTPVAGK